jgi:DNA-binding NarL/FixJ family response regulator
VEPLTNRELDVLRGLVRGLSDKQIAQEQGITEPTVRFHMRAIGRKLGLCVDGEQGGYARRNQLLDD